MPLPFSLVDHFRGNNSFQTPGKMQHFSKQTLRSKAAHNGGRFHGSLDGPKNVFKAAMMHSETHPKQTRHHYQRNAVPGALGVYILKKGCNSDAKTQMCPILQTLKTLKFQASSSKLSHFC